MASSDVNTTKQTQTSLRRNGDSGPLRLLQRHHILPARCVSRSVHAGLRLASGRTLTIPRGPSPPAPHGDQRTNRVSPASGPDPRRRRPPCSPRWRPRASARPRRRAASPSCCCPPRSPGSARGRVTRRYSRGDGPASLAHPHPPGTRPVLSGDALSSGRSRHERAVSHLRRMGQEVPARTRSSAAVGHGTYAQPITSLPIRKNPGDRGPWSRARAR